MVAVAGLKRNLSERVFFFSYDVLMLGSKIKQENKILRKNCGENVQNASSCYVWIYVCTCMSMYDRV